jgi:hypothetical protein
MEPPAQSVTSPGEWFIPTHPAHPLTHRTTYRAVHSLTQPQSGLAYGQRDCCVEEIPVTSLHSKVTKVNEDKYVIRGQHSHPAVA